MIPHLEPEIALLPLAPAVLPVKVEVAALLVIFSYGLRVVRSLEPCQVLFVEAPRLFLQLLCRAPPGRQYWRKAFPPGDALFICAGHVVENVEQLIDVQTRIYRSVLQYRSLSLRVI